MRLDALLFDPLLPLWLMVALALAVLGALALAAFRRLAGWPYRGFAVICVFLALLNPSLKTEERQAEADIVLVVVDRSSSQALSDRAAQTEEALAHLAKAGFDPLYGGRPMKRVLQRVVLNELSKSILSGKIQKDSAVLMDVDKEGNLTFENVEVEI